MLAQCVQSLQQHQRLMTHYSGGVCLGYIFRWYLSKPRGNQELCVGQVLLACPVMAFRRRRVNKYLAMMHMTHAKLQANFQCLDASL
jgi:hypothetical protein